MPTRIAALPICVCLLVLQSTAPADEPTSTTKERWVYLSTNMLVDKNVESDIALIQRAAKDGYNGIVLTDSKFLRWDSLPPKYLQNVRKISQTCRDSKMKLIACVAPMGYSNDLLSRDPNLAEGLPVVDAPFVVRKDTILPADDPAVLANGSFEQYKGDSPAGWGWADMPGKITFIDTQVKHDGAASLRMQDIGTNDPQHGHGRVCQTVKVAQFRNYHVSAWVKTENFEAANEVRIAVLAQPGGTALNYFEPQVAKTQDWKQIDITFNSLDNSQVNIYLGIWGGKGGKIWWDDVRLEPAGLVNAVRRDGAPLKMTSQDGKTIYTEGKDFDGAKDPKLGMIPYAGCFSVWHDVPPMAVPADSSLKDGQTVLLSYFHTAIIHADQVPCCLAEPKVFEIVKWQVEQVRDALNPDGYFMSHDEIRIAGWDDSCVKAGKTPGEVLAANVNQCAEIIRKADPGKAIYVWSDMFDPTHNAKKTGKYYLVKGDGPWYDSWKGLPKGICIVTWQSDKSCRADSLKHFADLGCRQILAGYYDSPPKNIVDWLADAAKVRGVEGVMYTTWRNNFDDLEGFVKELEKGK